MGQIDLDIDFYGPMAVLLIISLYERLTKCYDRYKKSRDDPSE